ncbi:Lcl domain-containing protein [Enterovibrio coralii]|uniref:Lcl domain-containing protein n=1 Tax=Enterovibrio coralii TaxID=294935 RepID=UPI000ACEB075|nr:DUF1566 domain-containing protein [Enterovibrio coralii]
MGTSTDLHRDGIINSYDKLSEKNARTYAELLRLGGYNDWRLPTIKELYSLILFDGQDPSGLRQSGKVNLLPFIDNLTFEMNSGDVQRGERLIDSQFVSSTRYVSTTMRRDETVFGVNFIDGRIKGYGISNPKMGEKKFYVLVVRGNPNYGVNNYAVPTRGVVTDKATSLVWQQNDSQKAMDFPSALAYCERLELAGRNDWRLPNAKELQSIVDYTRSPATTDSAAIDSRFQATVITNEAGQEDYANYWSSTTHLNLKGASNAVYLSFGRALGNLKGNWMDVHGAGSQRSDPKTGSASRYKEGHGPQGDAVRIQNFARCVAGGNVTFDTSPALIARTKQAFESDAQGTQAQQPQLRRDQFSFQRASEKERREPEQERPNPMVDLDSNKDGKLSYAEVRGPLQRDFEKFDANQDGYLSESEMPKGPPPKHKKER